MLPPRDRNVIGPALTAFAAGTTPNADVKKLRGGKTGEYRLRIGRFRAIFLRVGDDIVVLQIVARKDAY